MIRIAAKLLLGLLAGLVVLGLSPAGPALAQEMTRLEIHPGQATVRAGSSLRFTAVARDPKGYSFAPRQVTWQASSGRMDQSGLFTAGSSPGSVRIQARAIHTQRRAVQAVITIRVVGGQAEVSRIVITPPSANVRVGQSVSFRAQAYDSHNRPVSFRPVWRVNGGGKIDATGRFEARQTGRWFVTVGQAKGGPTARAAVTVVADSLIQPGQIVLTLTPTNARLRPGQRMQFRVQARDGLGRSKPINPSWKAEGGRIDSRGIYTAGNRPGRYRVWARDSRTGKTVFVQVTILAQGGRPVAPTTARIAVNGFSSGQGNFIKPMVKINLQVFGDQARQVRLYAVDPAGRLTQLAARSCANGSRVTFNSRYTRAAAKWFEVRLFDAKGKLIARQRRAAK